MEYIQLKNSDLTVSRFCMGGCPMGGYGWGAVQEDELIAAVHRALDHGVTFFDTADTYGLGQSERTLGKALSARRKDVIIQSKFGVKAGHGQTVYDNSPSYIRQALTDSLTRLNTEYIDLYTIHYRDYSTPIEEVVDTLRSLKQEGKIRYFGLSNIHEDTMAELLPYKGEFVTCQDEYSLACRNHERDLRLLADELAVTPLTWGSLGQGILTGKYTRENVTFGSDDRRSRDIYVNFHGAKLDQNLRIVDRLKTIAAAHGTSVPSCAIRFILDYLPGSVVLAGVKRPAPLLSNLESFGWTLTPDEIALLNEVSQ